MSYPVSRPSIGARETEAVLKALRSGWITSGPAVQTFEEGFAKYLQVDPKKVVACTSGTTALHLALIAAGVKQGDEVLVPDLTYIATAGAVRMAGAVPVPVDVDPRTWTIDVVAAEYKFVPRRTTAIVPVHLYGVPAEMDTLLEFAESRKLLVIEDAAEGLGATYQGQRCGTFGRASAFSFYGNKVITTGEGGIAVFSDLQDAAHARLLRGQGQGPRRFYHEVFGFNYRMTDLQAAVGVAQLSRIEALLEKRREVVDAYLRTVHSGKGPMIEGVPGCSISPWLFTFLVPTFLDRNEIQEALQKRGIETRPTFCPLHRMPMFRRPDASYPVASDLGDRGISLPTYADLLVSDAEEIGSVYEELVNERA